MTFPTPETAEFAFYAALETGDLDAMMTVWESGEHIVCIHPMGPRRQGVAQLRESWRQIFSSGAKLRFHISGAHSVIQDDLAIRVVYEHITVLGVEEQPAQPVIATNVYRRTGGGWRLILHHASPGPASGGQPNPSSQLH